MRIYLSDQSYKFKQHLDFLKDKKIMDYDKSRLTEKITTIDIKTNKNFDQLNLGFLFDYKIFPDNIMTFKNQWLDENRKMKIGDTIAQQVWFPPFKIFSQKIIFGVRINEIIDQTDKKGFSYETLEGHVEKGISTFTVERLDNKIVFKVQTYSTLGNILTKLAGPFFAVPYQTFCTKTALKNVKRQLEVQWNWRLKKKADRITAPTKNWRFSAPQTHLWLIKQWHSASTFVVKIANFL